MNLKTAALMAVPLIGVRTAHIAFPSMEVATALWFVAALMIAVWARHLHRIGMPLHGAVAVGAGALSNGLVMLVNGGAMPVIGMHPEDSSGVWRSAEHGGHLMFLADRMSLGGASPGDFLIAAGLLFTVGVVVVRGLRSLWVRRAVSLP